MERQWRAQVAPAGRTFVEPHKKEADLVLDGTAWVEVCMEVLLREMEPFMRRQGA